VTETKLILLPSLQRDGLIYNAHVVPNQEYTEWARK